MRRGLFHVITLLITIVVTGQALSIVFNPRGDCWAEYSETSVGETTISHACGIHGTLSTLLHGDMGTVFSILSLVIGIWLYWFSHTPERGGIFSAFFLASR